MSKFQPGDRVEYNGNIWTIGEPTATPDSTVNLGNHIFGRDLTIPNVDVYEVRDLDRAVDHWLATGMALCHELLGDDGPEISESRRLRVQVGELLKAALEERAE